MILQRNLGWCTHAKKHLLTQFVDQQPYKKKKQECSVTILSLYAERERYTRAKNPRERKGWVKKEVRKVIRSNVEHKF